LLTSKSVEKLDPHAKLDFGELKWTDKENVLRVLFSKMNGQDPKMAQKKISV
jgi:hypothetical protein